MICSSFSGSSSSVILGVSRVGGGGGGGQHDSWEAAVLVVRVQGQGGAVLQAVGSEVGGSRRALLCCRVVPGGVGLQPVGLQLRVMHELRGDVGLAGVSQGVLHRPLHLHPPVLEPVSDLRHKQKR